MRYRSVRVFSLTRSGPRWFIRNFTCSVLLGCRQQLHIPFFLTGLSPSMAGFSTPFKFLIYSIELLAVTPRLSHYPTLATAAPWHQCGLGSSPFARRYSGNRFYFLFLGLLRCFSSPAYLFRVQSPTVQVAPFGYPGIIALLQLPQAFRSLTRPSSALTT